MLKTAREFTPKPVLRPAPQPSGLRVCLLGQGRRVGAPGSLYGSIERGQPLVNVHRVHLGQQLARLHRVAYINLDAQDAPGHRRSYHPAAARFDRADAKQGIGSYFIRDNGYFMGTGFAGSFAIMAYRLRNAMTRSGS